MQVARPESIPLKAAINAHVALLALQVTDGIDALPVVSYRAKADACAPLLEEESCVQPPGVLVVSEAPFDPEQYNRVSFAI